MFDKILKGQYKIIPDFVKTEAKDLLKNIL